MSGFGFLSPLLLGFSALAVPIFLLYMLRLRRTDQPISSTFLWQQLVRDREANAPWQKLRPNLLLLLQLLILAALVLALARPYREVETIVTGRVVLLLDASASMNATDVGGASRFEAARDLALDTIDTLGADDTMTVIRVAAVPEVLAAASRDRSVLRDAINDAEPGKGSADWSAALTLASAGSRGVESLRVVILSDGGLPADLPELPGELRYVKIGEDDDNVAITALSTRALPGEAPQLFAQVTNFGDRDTEVTFQIRLDDDLYDSRFREVPARSVVDVSVEDLPPDFLELKAIITPRSGVDVPDHLDDDNTAYAVNAEASTGEVLVMTEGNTFLELGLSTLPGINVTIASPERGLPSGDYDLVAFDGWLPNQSLPDTDLLIINPPESTNYFEVTGETNATTIDSLTGGVLREDERTRFVDFANVDILKIRTLERIDWATVLFETTEGDPLVLAGEVDGRQIAVITFALQDSNLPLQPAWPILMARLNEWYQPQRAINDDNLSPGEAIVVRPTTDADVVRIEAPGGDDTTLELEDAPEVIYADTSDPGLYHVEVLLEGEVVQSDAFAVNLFDAGESNITPVEEILVQTQEGETTIASTTREETGRRELWTLLVSAGLLILGIEWWYYHRSLNRKPKPVSPQILQGRQRRPKNRRWWQRI
ncbi:MAG: VWA domain-containing protein [Chloroflexi bacterium]|nr:VWA domain-containing protein [Chloroflexota bacterium]